MHRMKSMTTTAGKDPGAEMMAKDHQELVQQSRRQLLRRQLRKLHQEQKDMAIHHTNINRLRKKETEQTFSRDGERWTGGSTGRERGPIDHLKDHHHRDHYLIWETW